VPWGKVKTGQGFLGCGGGGLLWGLFVGGLATGTYTMEDKFHLERGRTKGKKDGKRGQAQRRRTCKEKMGGRDLARLREGGKEGRFLLVTAGVDRTRSPKKNRKKHGRCIQLQGTDKDRRVDGKF